jgi:hypothetical protein
MRMCCWHRGRTSLQGVRTRRLGSSRRAASQRRLGLARARVAAHLNTFLPSERAAARIRGQAPVALAPAAPHSSLCALALAPARRFGRRRAPGHRKACSVGAAPRARPARHGRRGQRADGQPDHRGRLQRGRAPGPRRLPPCSGSLSRRGQKPGGANRFHTGAWQAPAMAAAARGACLLAGGRVAVEARRATRVQRQLWRGALG